MTSDKADRALRRAWAISEEDYSDQVYDEFATLLPALVAAGYAAEEGETWHYTAKGLARVEELQLDAPP